MKKLLIARGSFGGANTIYVHELHPQYGDGTIWPLETGYINQNTGKYDRYNNPTVQLLLTLIALRRKR